MPSPSIMPRWVHVYSAAPVRSFVVPVGLLLGFAAQSAAQEGLPSIPLGQSIRITSDLLPRRTIARFSGFRADTLLAMQKFGGPVSLPLSRIHHMETARQDRIAGALIGAPIGALVLTTGLAIFAHMQGGWLDCSGCPFRDDFTFGAIFGVPIGGIAGAITGGAIGRKRWDPVPGIPLQR